MDFFLGPSIAISIYLRGLFESSTYIVKEQKKRGLPPYYTIVMTLIISEGTRTLPAGHQVIEANQYHKFTTHYYTFAIL